MIPHLIPLLSYLNQFQYKGLIQKNHKKFKLKWLFTTLFLEILSSDRYWFFYWFTTQVLFVTLLLRPLNYYVKVLRHNKKIQYKLYFPEGKCIDYLSIISIWSWFDGHTFYGIGIFSQAKQFMHSFIIDEAKHEQFSACEKF